MKYFNDIKDIKDLKKRYKKLARELHPDLGGSEEDFKAMGAEYDVLYKRIKEGIKAANGSNFDVVDDGYKEVIEQLLHMELDVELCGEWLWIGGNTKPVKEQLKAMGCKWANKKKLWYWKPAWMKPSYHRKEYSMEDIRSKYGSVDFKSKQNHNELEAG